MSWHESTLGAECELYQPQTLAKNDLDNSGIYKVYGANGVIGTHSKFNHENPQLLVTCRGATCGTINISEAKSWINGNAMVVKPRNANIDLYFLSHYLHHLDISKAITGAAQPQITRQSLAPIKIKFPPLAEQKRITAILDKAAEIKAKRELAIAKLNELAQSRFVEMFGDPVTNNKDWDVAAIGDLPLFIADGNYSSKYPTASEFVESGVPFIRANNLKQLTVIEKDLRFITPEKHKELAKGHLKHKDVLVITRGEIGKVGLVPKIFEDANINAQLVLMRCTDNQVQPEYLCHLFNNKRFSTFIENFQTGAALKQLPVGNLKKIKIPLPSISMQESFSKFIKTLEVQFAALRESDFRTKSLFKSLEHQAFTRGFNT
jgi:type I restriction enzyme S subunit